MRRFLRQTRVRLTLTYTGVVTLALCVGGAIFWVVFSDALMGSIDSSLRGQAQILASDLRAGSGIAGNGTTVLPTVSPEGAPIAALVLADDGRVIDQAGQPINAGAARALAQQERDLDAQPVIESRSIGSVEQRVLVQGFEVKGAHATLILSRSLEEYDQTIAITLTLLGGTVIVLALGAGLSAYWLAGRVLRPVRIITATARDLGEHSLDRRITLDLPPDEFGELAATFNQMLDRIEAAFTTLQRFTADAAHELRSPLTALRAEVEVVMRRPREGAEYRATLDIVLTEIERLSGVTDQLLLLARADAGTLQARREAVDVPDLLEEIGDRWRHLAARTETEIVVTAPGEGVFDADPVLLRRLLTNLIDNAIRHTPPHGRVEMSAALDEQQLVLTVRDSGPGVDRAIRPLLFKRFHASGHQIPSGGAGLGLSLCAAIAAAHGGTITLDDGDEGGGAVFVVTLPVLGVDAPP